MDWKNRGGWGRGWGGSWRLPRSFLKSGAKQMEVTAVHNHLRFRHGGSCWEQIKPLQTQLRIPGVEQNQSWIQKSPFGDDCDRNTNLTFFCSPTQQEKPAITPLSSFVITSTTRFLSRPRALHLSGKHRFGPDGGGPDASLIDSTFPGT